MRSFAKASCGNTISHFWIAGSMFAIPKHGGRFQSLHGTLSVRRADTLCFSFNLSLRCMIGRRCSKMHLVQGHPESNHSLQNKRSMGQAGKWEYTFPFVASICRSFAWTGELWLAGGTPFVRENKHHFCSIDERVDLDILVRGVRVAASRSP